MTLLDRCRAAGKIVAGYGASPTVTTLLHQFDLGRRIDFLVDDNPTKQYAASPGHGIPGLSVRGDLRSRLGRGRGPGLELRAPIMAKHRRFAESGGRFVVPLPQLQVI